MNNALDAAWAAFDQTDWATAAAGFAALIAGNTNTSKNAETSPHIAAEAAFGLAHTQSRMADDAGARASLLQALAAAVEDVDLRFAFTRAWTPRSGRNFAIDVTKLGLGAIKLSTQPSVIARLRVLALIYEASGDLLGTLLACHGLWALGVKEPALFVKMGRVYLTGQNSTEAARFFHKALREEDYLPALDGLSEMALAEGDVNAARDLLQRRAAASRNPSERAAALFKAAIVQPLIAFDDNEINTARMRLANAFAIGPTVPIANPWELALGPIFNFYMSYQGRDDRAIQEAAAAYYLAATPSLAARARHVDQPRTGGKIHLGIVSNYFDSHTISYLNRGLIMGIDRNRFDVVLFRTPRARFGDSTRTFSQSARIIDLPTDLSAARRIISEAACDILHYPEIGMDPFTYFLAFARLAKVQTVGWGHPVTTGIPNIDLFLSVDAMEPNDGEKHYSERLVRLKSLSIDVEKPILAGAAPSPTALGLETNRPVYLCAQSLYKLHHHFDETIALILERDRDGWIYFISHRVQADQLFLKRLARRVGDYVARVRILPRVSPDTFLHLLHTADVLLDVPQWSGGKTSLEGLSVGTPIVHCPGAYMRGRHTLAFYRRMGITQTVVDNASDYADSAIKLVHDRRFRMAIREQIAATSEWLFGNVEAIRETERVWLDALEATQ